ncbi:MAG: hypothetical protein WDA04_00880 [Anaerolineaceae bacterium]|jgi:hypothetical protein|nr:hypothetical protein [Anaerolineaceae bacterium]
MSYQKQLFLTILFVALTTSGCSAFNKGKISQDFLPGKESGQILFEDDFDDHSTGWEVVNNAYELKGYSTGGYMISINQPSSRAISTTNLSYTNTEISVETQKITGARDTQFGLVCRYQDKFNFYSFVISADGYAGIVRIVDGLKELIGSEQFIRVESLNLDDGQNRMTALCSDDNLILEVNGETILKVKDDTFSSGDTGLFVETFEVASAAVVFNDFLIKKP